MSRPCPVCFSSHATDLVRLEGVPVLANVPQPSFEAARAVPRGDMNIAACGRCGHVYNRTFDPALIAYMPGYENSLMFSPKLRRYAEKQAADLADRYSLHGREVVELGCGDAAFLAMLAKRGARCTGYDPSAASVHTTAEGITVVNRDFSETIGPLAADLVVCRHVLEHVAMPREFLFTLQCALVKGAETGVFFEVPNALSTFRDLAIWDLVYEHPSYFWQGSLAFAFACSGFAVEHVEETFEGQFLTIHARIGSGAAIPTAPDPAKHAEIRPFLDSFATVHREKRQYWRHELARCDANGRRVSVWGAGTKGVMFANEFRDFGCLESAIDVNPRKRGLYLAGSGRPIIAPDDLLARPPDTIVVMNPAYAHEIRAQTRTLGVDARLLEA